MIRLAVAGASGRTGSRVVALALEDDGFDLVCAMCEPGSRHIEQPVPGYRTLRFTDALSSCDVVIDLTTPAGTASLIPACREQRCALVSGVTSLDDQTRAGLFELAREVPVLYAANFSFGMAVTMKLVELAARCLGSACDIEIIETHHRGKVDAPSGTANVLVERLRKSRADLRESKTVAGRSGQIGPRPVGEIGVHSVRMGDAPGTHEIRFAGRHEVVMVRHDALSRDTFAAGALQCASWIHGAKSGRLYSVSDALELANDSCAPGVSNR